MTSLACGGWLSLSLDRTSPHIPTPSLPRLLDFHYVSAVSNGGRHSRSDTSPMLIIGCGRSTLLQGCQRERCLGQIKKLRRLPPPLTPDAARASVCVRLGPYVMRQYALCMFYKRCKYECFFPKGLTTDVQFDGHVRTTLHKQKSQMRCL